jgi:protein-export membrane protein SecD
MINTRIYAVGVLLLGALFGWFVYASEMGSINRPFKLGLDLSGGTHLVYRADTSQVFDEDIEDSMNALRDTIERRVNVFGVAEPLVQTELSSGLGAGEREQRLIVELPGVTDTEEAIRLIGQTPVLEFLLMTDEAANSTSTEPLGIGAFEPTGLTGRFISRAQLEFQAVGGTQGLPTEPAVLLTFNSEGAELFETLTTENVGRVMGIFLDGQVISAPVINEPIPGGTAVVSGSFTAEEARELARNINFGALPVPIELISTQTIGAGLGEEALQRGIYAGIWSIIAVIIFMILWYRALGAIAAIALSLYVVAMLAVFKLVPVTLTAAGIAAFILSVGMAVDANVLIFERMKEEFNPPAGGGKRTRQAAQEGFARAWTSIRDSNVSSMITAVILFWFGTSIVKGFALVFGIGVLVSMLSAITASRLFILSLGDHSFKGVTRFLFGTGFKI